MSHSCLKLVLFMLEVTIYSIKPFVCLISEELFWEVLPFLCEVSLQYLVWFLEHTIAIGINVLKLCELYVTTFPLTCRLLWEAKYKSTLKKLSSETKGRLA